MKTKMILILTAFLALAANGFGSGIRVSTQGEVFPADPDFYQKNYSAHVLWNMGKAGGVSLRSLLKGNWQDTHGGQGHYFNENIYGLGYQLLIRGEKIDFMGGVVSESDRPFHSIDEVEFFSAGFYNVWKNKRHSLGLGDQSQL